MAAERRGDGRRGDGRPSDGGRCPSCEKLAAENQSLKNLLAEVERAVEQLRRAGKRQSAPFSKGDPEPEPLRAGRKKGKAHGRHSHRPVPPEVDRELDALLPTSCPHCGEGVDFERWDEQLQTELPEVRPSVTRFRVGVGRCRGCKRRVQARHPEQTSDALGAAASQVGPRAMAWGTWLHDELGLSFGKCSALMARSGIDVTAGAICSSSASTSTALGPIHQAIKAHVASSPAVTMDETGWRLVRRCHEMIEDLPADARHTPRQVKDLLLEALDARVLDAKRRAAAVAHIGDRIDLHATNLEWRGVRPAVVNRKVWGGDRTERGAEDQGRLMTFLRTARQQGADAIALLVHLARAPAGGVVTGLILRPG